MKIALKRSLKGVASITAGHVKTAEALKNTLKIICAASVPKTERGYGRKKEKTAMMEKQIEAALVKRVKALGGMAEEIRKAYFSRELTQKQLAAKYAISQEAVCRIVSGWTWNA